MNFGDMPGQAKNEKKTNKRTNETSEPAVFLIVYTVHIIKRKRIRRTRGAEWRWIFYCILHTRIRER